MIDVKGDATTMKFRAHDTFFIRKGWLSKGVKNIVNKPDVFVSKDENPMDALGIGANMVKALRYWLQAVGLTVEPSKGKRIQTLTPLGEQIYNNDRYIEEVGTRLLLHYRLASNRDEATAWWYFFNVFAMTEFTKEEFISSMQSYLLSVEDGESVALRSLGDDFNCIVSTYLPRYKSMPGRVSAENNIDCPFGELGLIDIVNRQKKSFRKAFPSPATINPWVALAIIVEQAQGREELKLNELLIAPCNIGKMFNLDAVTMLEVLFKIEKLGCIKIIRTAGMDIVRLNKQYSFEECVAEYYNSL